jgi:hypothetical protein
MHQPRGEMSKASRSMRAFPARRDRLGYVFRNAEMQGDRFLEDWDAIWSNLHTLNLTASRSFRCTKMARKWQSTERALEQHR